MSFDSLFPDLTATATDEWRVRQFSTDNLAPALERERIEERYWPLTEVTTRFNRQSVSYQLSKNDRLHRWLKYKEGFSASLVRDLLADFGIAAGGTVLDPFMGSGTTALVARLAGMNSAGFDVLPMSKIAIEAKEAVYQYDLPELRSLIESIEADQLPDDWTEQTPQLSITADGYPQRTAREIAYFTHRLDEARINPLTRNLARLCLLNCLERVSYSAKDGQYLRWDYRCPKIIAAVADREARGRKPFTVRLDKGELPSLQSALAEELRLMLSDIADLQRQEAPQGDPHCHFQQRSALEGLPELPGSSIDAVVTSPPYCNRYDYTRTYALELAWLGIDEQRMRQLRQELLSCTVESHPKMEWLRNHYETLGRTADFERLAGVARNNATLNEIRGALRQRNEAGEINNKGVLRMVDGYFTELTFIFGELLRVCRPGAHVAFVNDNVRYAGEVVPVDFLSCQLAEQLGFTVERVYTLKQQKGNSSQQMKRYGRLPLRKSVTVWRKP